MSNLKPSLRALAALAAAITLSAACSIGNGGITGAAEDLIEGEFADRNHMDLSNASCDDPPSEDVGTTFTCTADYKDLAAEFEVLIDAEGHIVARSTNAIYPNDQLRIGQVIADSFSAEGVDGVTADGFTCGPDPVLIGSGEGENVIGCLLTNADGETYLTSIRMHDLSTLTFDFNVADAPIPASELPEWFSA